MTTRLLMLVACATLLAAAEGGASITAAPGFEAPRPTNPSPAPAVPRSFPPMPRMATIYEVEVLQVKPGDSASLSHWVELAAQGYHTVAANTTDGGTLLYLERVAAPGATAVQLPASVEQDKALADALRAKLQAIVTERQRTIAARSAPAWAPVHAEPTAPAAK